MSHLCLYPPPLHLNIDTCITTDLIITIFSNMKKIVIQVLKQKYGNNLTVKYLHIKNVYLVIDLLLYSEDNLRIHGHPVACSYQKVL